jgi:WD40 repeat protein/tRNA A-37 threonylcarbamoyl transferase component Bud32
MDDNQWQRVEELLQQALDLETSERKVFLDRACGPDSDLRRQVEMLLKKEDEARSFIETPAVAHLAASIVHTSRTSLIGKRVSHYRIDSLIGEGGMGEVYKAYDERLRREVALKILPMEFIGDSERARRFEQEAFTTSKLNHPNIVTIFEIVRADGAQFIASEYIEGRTLRQFLSEKSNGNPRPLPLDQAIEIAIQIASALRAAHTAWIIHRDIKPENIMVRADGVVKVLDFGIAKLARHEELQTSAHAVPNETEGSNGYKTVAGAIVGTASYMSPEQAKGEPLDGRTDVFSLGAVLYEMLTGERLLGASVSTSKTNSELQPARRTENLPRAVERIIRKATREQREARYGSAAEMLDDLLCLKQRLENRSARRIAQFSAAGLLMIVALAGLSAWASRGQVWDERILRDGHTAAVRRAVFSPDGRRLVSIGEDHQIIVWDFARRERVKTLTDHTGTVNAVAFSPDGGWFATGSDDRTIIIWDAARLQPAAVLRDQPGPVLSLVFSPDGKRLVSGYGGTVGTARVLDTTNWQRLCEFSWRASYGEFVFLSNDQLGDITGRIWNASTGKLIQDAGPEWAGNWVDLSPDGKQRASITTGGDVKIIDLKSQKLLYTRHAHFDHGRSVAYSRDGKWLATAAEKIILWDAKTLEKIAPLEYESIVWSVAFSPGGQWLVSTHGDGAILVWDVNQRERVANLREHSAGVRGVAFSSDGKLAASASEDQSVLVWDVATGQKEAVLAGHKTRVTSVAFAPTGQWLASADQDGTIIRWNLQQRVAALVINAPEKDTPSYFIAISRDGRLIAATHGVYDSETGRGIASLVGEWGAVYSAVFTSDGRVICVTDRGNVVVWDTRTWRIVTQQRWAEEPLITVSLSPDEKRLVTGDDGKAVRLGTLDPLHQEGVVGRHEARIKSVCFTPDGSFAASAGDDKMIALWDVNRKKIIAHIGTHTSPVYAVAFSPNGNQLISGEHDHSVRLYTRHRTISGFRFD